MASQEAIQRKRERNLRYYRAHRDAINARKKEKRRGERERAMMSVEERYMAEELGKYGPETEEIDTRTPEEIMEMRIAIYKALGIRAGKEE